MALEQNSQLGAGGSGFQGNGPGTAAAMIAELQGLTISLLAGQTTPNQHALAALRPEDTIVKALNNNAGTITDITANITIADNRASGTITLATSVAGNTVTVNGKVYTAVAGVAANNTQFSIGGTDTQDAAGLAVAINSREANGNNEVSATSALGVVTVRATADGTGGNAITLSRVGAPITVTGAGTLTAGSATGGFTSSSTTNQVILFWFNKK